MEQGCVAFIAEEGDADICDWSGQVCSDRLDNCA